MFIFSKCYRPYTGVVQLRGPENIGLQRTIPAAASKSPVQSHLRITLENNEKIRPEPDRENAFARASGGWEGILPRFPGMSLIHRRNDTVSRFVCDSIV